MKAYSLRDARRLAAGTNNWRQAVWNRWLIGYLTPESTGQNEECTVQKVSTPRSKSEISQAPRADGSVSADSIKADDRTTAEDPIDELKDFSLGPPPWDTRRGDTEVESQGTARTRAVRARLDRLLEQMDEVEGTVDRVAERQSAFANHQRIQHREFTDLLDRLVETQERHTESLIACTRALERLERRAMWNERNLRNPVSISSEFSPLSQRPLQDPPLSTIVPPSTTQRVQRASGDRASIEPNAPLSGKLSDISLPTLLSTAELEMWTGRLTLETRSRTVQVDLETGLLVGVFEDDSPSDAVEALHELLDARDGRFSFSPAESVVKTELAPLMVGTLLLRASHLRDEMNRADVGS